jgi:hypothetical protein
MDVRKLTATLLLFAACRSTPAPDPAPRPSTTPATTPSSSQPGAATAAAAVRAYLASAQSQDLQAMSVIWGSKDGPARATLPRDELEKRELINIRCLTHDNYDILSEAPSAAGKRVFAVMLRRRDQTRTTNFYAVPGPSGRWYLESFEQEPIREFCVAR